MSATRVESPLLQEFRRQPSPPFAATMPKPRACRKLFPVDQAETNRFLRDQRAEFEKQQRDEFGFDFDRYEPLPDQDSRYGEWEAIPEDRVPSFYRETEARRKPFRQSSRPSPFTSSSHQSSNNGSNHSGLASSSTVKEIQTESSRVETGSPRSFLAVHPEDVRQVPAKSFTSTASNNPHPIKNFKPVLEQASGSEKPYHCDGDIEVCPGLRDNNEKAKGTFSTRSSSAPVTNIPTTLASQSKITDFWRQRKRHGSDCSSMSSTCSSNAEEGKLHQQVPPKRRRSSGSSSGEDPLPLTGRS